MKLICTQENLKKAIFGVEKITSKQLTLPILNNLLLETVEGSLVLSATNLEIGVIAKIRAKIEEEGKIAVPVKLLSNFISNLPVGDNIEIKTDGLMMFIKCGKYKAKINCLDAGDFPIIPEKKENPQFSVKKEKLKKVIETNLNSVALNDTRIEFTGINIVFNNDVYFASTDSFRLSENMVTVKKESEYGNVEGKSIIVPAETMRELNRILSGVDDNIDVIFTVEENQIFFEISDVKMVSRLINGKYPDYKQIIPEKFKTTVIVNKKEMAQSIKIASIFTKNTDGEVEIKIEGDGEKAVMKVKSEIKESGENETELDVIKNGEDQSFVVNPRFLIDGINNIDTENMQLLINESNAPIGLKKMNDKNEIDDSYIYIIMPIKKD